MGGKDVLQEILTLKKKLQKIIIENDTDGKNEKDGANKRTLSINQKEDIIDILKQLEDVEIDRSILSKTKIGVVVGNLRKQNDACIRSYSNKLVTQWKEALAQANAKNEIVNTVSVNKANSVASSASCFDASVNTACLKPKIGNSFCSPSCSSSIITSSTNNSSVASTYTEIIPEGIYLSSSANLSSSSSLNNTSNESSISYENYTGPKTGDSVRDKARQFIWKALIEGVPDEQENSINKVEAGKLAGRIEEALYREYMIKKKNQRDYSMQLKSIKFNLADKKNADLNYKIYLGVITPEELAVMASTDMASESKKMEREKQRKESLEACQSDWDIRNMMKSHQGQFQCGKCKKNKTIYFQMQTRSSDEPMTTFVTCLNCGNRWKF